MTLCRFVWMDEVVGKINAEQQQECCCVSRCHSHFDSRVDLRWEFGSTHPTTNPKTNNQHQTHDCIHSTTWKIALFLCVTLVGLKDSMILYFDHQYNSWRDDTPAKNQKQNGNSYCHSPNWMDPTLQNPHPQTKVAITAAMTRMICMNASPW